jgi:hypothetical protein
LIEAESGETQWHGLIELGILARLQAEHERVRVELGYKKRRFLGP